MKKAASIRWNAKKGERKRDVRKGVAQPATERHVDPRGRASDRESRGTVPIGCKPAPRRRNAVGFERGRGSVDDGTELIDRFPGQAGLGERCVAPLKRHDRSIGDFGQDGIKGSA